MPRIMLSRHLSVDFFCAHSQNPISHSLFMGVCWSRPCLGGFLAPLAPNARFQARWVAGATQERRLSTVACKPLFGGVARLPRSLRTHGIRLDHSSFSTSDEGRPITVSPPDSPYARPFRAIATRVWEKVSGKTSARWAGPRSVVA